MRALRCGAVSLWSLRMAAVETTLSFDDILEAVRESRRGRWFLDEFENRMRRSETANLLAAVAKLEGVVTGMGSSKGPEAELLARAKAAILAARKDIATIDPASSGLSEEGRLFAKLADMARRSFAANSNVSPAAVNSGVIRALRLVDELEADLCGDGSAAPAASAQTATYFRQDADVFEAPQPVAKPSAEIISVVAKKPEPEPMARGAKLVINRLPARSEDEVKSEAPAATETAVVEPSAAPAEAVREETSADVFKAEAPKPAEPQRQTPRVVIIRKKPEEMTEVPMIDQPATSENAA